MGPGGGGGGGGGGGVAISWIVNTPEANSSVILVSYAAVVCWKSAER